MENRKFNRTVFAQLVLPAFVAAYTCGSDIRAVYSKFISQLNNDTNPNHRAQNDERRKILENCLTFFTDTKMRDKIEIERGVLKELINQEEYNSPIQERNPSYSELSKRLISVFSEKLFGDNKRRYDMSCKYSSGLIASRKAPDGSIIKGVKVSPVNNLNISSWSLQDNSGRTISFRLIGRLHYLNGLGEDDYLDQFSVQISKDNSDEDAEQHVVFTNIDLNKVGESSEYRWLVVNELFNKNNIELSNTSGYIGEIINTQSELEQLSVGKELDEDGGVYRYQIAPQYALIYDPEHVSAVMDYSKQQELINQLLTHEDSSGR